MEWGILGGLPEQDRQAVHARMVRRRYRRNEIVFHEGEAADRLYLVTKGRLLARVETAEGDDSALEVYGAGDVIGEQILTPTANENPSTVVALETTELLSLTAEDAIDLRESSPTIDQAFNDAIAEQMKSLMSLLQEARYLPADKRVLRRVIALETHFASEHRSEIRITQKDLASMAGTTRPTANRALQRAEQAGALNLARSRIIVADRSALEKMAR